MSEKNNGSSKKSVSALVATIFVALLAVAAIVLLMKMTKQDDTPSQITPDGSEVAFKPSDELVEECGENAQRLMEENYTVVRMFVSEGLPHLNEPYGNAPEDGLYTVSSDDYKTYEELEAFVRSVYTAEEAERIMTRMPSDPGASVDGTESGAGSGSGNSTESGSSDDTSDSMRPELIAIYAVREIYSESASENEPTGSRVPEVVLPDPDSSGEFSKPAEHNSAKQKVLGINEDFKPYTAYNKPWGSVSIRIFPISEDECNITAYLGADKNVDISSVEDADILNTKMVRVDGEWRLTELIY